MCEDNFYGRRSNFDLCYGITADKPLKSMFRLNAKPSKCPIGSGSSTSYQFSYQRGHGLCDYPMSSMSQCSDKSKMVMRYQACADVKGSETNKEEVQCFGSWKEGSTFYFLGMLNNSHLRHDDYERRFRCFAYQSIFDGFKLSKSGEAKCDIWSAEEGDTTMKLRRGTILTGFYFHASENTMLLVLVTSPGEQCHLPKWVLSEHHQYLSLNKSIKYHFNKKGNSLTIASPGFNGPKKLKCSSMDQQSSNFTRMIMQVNFEW